MYQEAGTYWADAPIRGADTAQAVVVAPKDASGRTIHVILEVTDDGQPPLTAYRRVIVKVSGRPKPTPEEAYLLTPITKLSGPASETGKWTFYRGINLNGPAIEIDGNRWAGDSAPNFVCKDRRLNSPHIVLRPPTDTARTAMIHSFRWDTRASLAMTHVPPGTYAVYVYVWEDNNRETLTFSLNGRVVVRHYNTGVAGEGRRLGPWAVTVTDGAIKLTSTGGAANVSGIEVWRKSP